MSNIFTEAMEAYKAIITDFVPMAKAAEAAQKQMGEDFDAMLTVQQFDVVLQYSLLQIAVSDGNVTKSEIEFIRDITQFSDFCFFLESVGFKNVTWQKIYETPESDLKTILDACKESIVSASHDFIYIFSLIDAGTEYDFSEDLKANLFKIMRAASAADGNADGSEVDDCYIFEILAEITLNKKKLSKN